MLELQQLTKTYLLPGGKNVPALQAVDLILQPGEWLGIVGESGSGKSTLARCIAHLEPVTSGRILYRQQDVTSLLGEALRQHYRQIQLVFQEPGSVFHPRMRIGEFLCEPLLNYKLMPRRQMAAEIGRQLERVGLSPAMAARYPHELSGGQLQRVMIARAISIYPEVIVFDEPTSALDVSSQQKILELLSSLRRETGVSAIFISHDLAVVQQVCERIAVMQEGRIVDVVADSRRLVPSELHPYTRKLIDAVPTINKLMNRSIHHG
ncbi:ABC transporter ATP-binding protein [Paenibacillus medicaginis]|uniref:ABC transporter ATP-binding protein n=1 Tax=Paenibacillus medicaginis TaxID=1470560 RepID=A0ABV5C335_9BACL